MVGYEVVGHPAEFRLPVKKMVLLRSALMFAVNQNLVSAAVLRSLLGMWIFGALLRRDLLSIPHAVFRFIEKNEDQVVNWWPVAREEVKAMAHVVPLMGCHVGAPILGWLFSTDAMGENDYDHGGFGIAVTELSDPEVDSLLQQGETLGRSIARLDGLHGAKFKMLRRVGGWPALHDRVLFSLQDNMPTACAMAKGRSPSFSLNRVLRMKAAVCLAARLRAFLPWVESARQPADELSRLQW